MAASWHPCVPCHGPLAPRLLSQFPQTGGVYAVYDNSGTLHYLGISRRASARKLALQCCWLAEAWRCPCCAAAGPCLHDSCTLKALLLHAAGSCACSCSAKLPCVILAAVQIAVSLATHAEALPAGLVHSVKVSRIAARCSAPGGAGDPCTAAAFFCGQAGDTCWPACKCRLARSYRGQPMPCSHCACADAGAAKCEAQAAACSFVDGYQPMTHCICADHGAAGREQGAAAGRVEGVDAGGRWVTHGDWGHGCRRLADALWSFGALGVCCRWVYSQPLLWWGDTILAALGIGTAACSGSLFASAAMAGPRCCWWIQGLIAALLLRVCSG